MPELFKNFLLKTSKFLTKKWFSSTNRPKIEVKASFYFIILNGFCNLGLVILWLFALLKFGDFPDEIPVHFTWDGSADYWGSKYFLFIELLILSLILGILTYVSKFYQFYNYPVEITIENAASQYQLALNYFVTMKFLNLILFGYIFSVMINGAYSKEEAFIQNIFWIVLILIFSSNFVYIYIAKKGSFKKIKTQ